MPGSGPRAGGGAVPWPAIFRRLSLAFGWTPAQIAQLTLPQLWMYLGENEQRGPRAISIDEARANYHTRLREKQAFVDQALAARARMAADRRRTRRINPTGATHGDRIG